MKFELHGFDKAGRAVRESVEAPDRAEATEQLRRRGYYVTELREATGAVPHRAAARSAGPGLFGRGALINNLVGSMRQLSVLVSTGTPLVEALASIENQTPPGKWREVLSNVKMKVEEGSQLSEAMAQHPRYFDPVCRSLVAAGEQGGGLDVMLTRLAGLLRQQQKVRRTVAGAMVYPVLLIFVSIGVVATMIGFVLPRFQGLFEGLGTPLPPSTRALMDVSEFIREQWVLVGLGVAGLGAGVPLWLMSAAGKRVIDTVGVRGPQIGRVVRGYATARIARLLGVLLEGKVPLLDALHLVGQSITNSHYAALIARATESVTRGESVTVAFSDASLIPPAVADAMRSGEKSGRMGPVMLTMADFLDEDNEVALKSITSLIEPAILLVLGMVVGAMAISMFLPLFDLAAGAAGGG